jgi:hypothetical protein
MLAFARIAKILDEPSGLSKRRQRLPSGHQNTLVPRRDEGQPKEDTMTRLSARNPCQHQPDDFDSVDFYTRNGHTLHARAAREGFGLVWQMLRRFALR